MDWKEIAKRLKPWVIQQESKQAIKEREYKKKIEHHQKECKRVVTMLAPQVKKVCKEFARSIGGSFSKHNRLASAFSNYGHGQYYLTSHMFGIHKSGHGSVVVSIYFLNDYHSDPDFYVMAKIADCTDSLFVKCEEAGFVSQIQTGYCIMKENAPSSDEYYVAAYKIPYASFTVEKLATVLEEFCKDIMSPEATMRFKFSYSLRQRRIH